MNRSLLSALLLFFVFIDITLCHASDKPSECVNNTKLVNLKNANSLSPIFDGLTDEAFTHLKTARDALRVREKLFEERFKNMTSLHHQLMTARLGGQHVFYMGPPGGAKSKLAHWFLSGEKEDPFKIQMNQLTPVMAFTGGQNFEKGRTGIYDVNTDGSAVEYVCWLIDETEKGNPATMGVFLQFLEERMALLGNKAVQAKLQTAISTSNALVSEIYKMMLEGGQPSTAQALLSRFAHKGLVWNWIPDQDDRIELLQYSLNGMFLEAAKGSHPELEKNAYFIPPPTIDWDTLRTLTFLIFRPTEEFIMFGDLFADTFRSAIHRKTRESEEAHFKDPRTNDLFIPSLDPNTRSLLSTPRQIFYSAMIDFLLSPLADDAFLEQVLKPNQTGSTPLTLDVASYWRAYDTATAVGPGLTTPSFDSDSGAITVVFPQVTNEDNLRNRREGHFLKNLAMERDAFSEAFTQIMVGYQKNLKMGAQVLQGIDLTKISPFNWEKSSFELLLLRHKQLKDQNGLSKE